MNEGMASSRRWRRRWSSNRGCLQRAGGAGGRGQGDREGGGESGRREIGAEMGEGWRDGGAAVPRQNYPPRLTLLPPEPPTSPFV